jgi:flagellar hook-associated protein 2
MAGLSSPGIGSGLDINGLVEKLVAAERAPRQAQITRAQTSAVTTISALGSLKGALGGFQGALGPLSTLSSFSARSATSSDPDIFTATATTSAAAGSYDIEVLDVASAHQISTVAGFTGGSSHVVGNGTLTIGVGTSSFPVVIDATAGSLAGIRDAINSASGNNNLVRATIVNGSDGAHLVLTSQVTGAANAITVAATGGNGGLAALNYDAQNAAGYAEPRPAADSQVRIAGLITTSASRTITDAIDGVTLTLLEEDAGETHTLTIANDTTAVSGRISAFVEQFNSLASTMGRLRSYEPATKAAGPLLGDAMLRGIESDIRGRLTDRVSGLSGNYQSLASIGITTSKDGTLSLDNAKLRAALTADYDGVAAIFGSANGVATKLKTAIDGRLAAGAELDVRSKRLNEQSVSLQKQVAELDTRMASAQKRYLKQFNALDGLLSQLQSTSSFLTQQLANISKIGSDS